MFLTMPQRPPGRARGSADLPKQKSLGHKLTWGEQSGSAQPLVRELACHLDSGACPWRSWPLPTSLCPTPPVSMPRCLLLTRATPASTGSVGSMGLMAKLLGVLVLCSLQQSEVAQLL